VEIPSIEPARDGWVGLATVTGQQWKDFCALIGREDLGEDPRFLNGTLRMQHVGFLHEIIHAWTREHTIDEIVELASAMRIPVSPIGDGRTLPRFDHVVARAVYVAHPGGFLQPRPPYRLGDASPRPPGPAPAIGEHTEEILTALGTRPPAAPRGGDAPAPPLGGLRVIDLTAFWAGPIATCYLASMGADVVKVESVQRPDGMRFAGTIGPHTQPMWEWCPVFAGANTGKRDVTLCLDREEGIALLHRLAATADVLVENFSPRVLENFGITWDALHELNPRLIMVRMPAFGLDGPWRDRTGFAMTIEQVSGLAWITGYADMPLVLRGACDPVGGMHAVFALYLALEERSRTGCGQLVEVPLVECALNVAAEQVIEHSAYGTLLCRDENRGPYAAPQGLYRCAAGGAYIALAVTTDAQWSALRTLLGAPRWARDDVLGTAAGRRAHHDEIDRGIHAWLADREAAAAVEELCAAGIPAACVMNAHDLMPNPQLEHREFFQTMHHPITGSTRYPGFPMRFSALGTRLHRRPPPTLGQHNDEILGGELGLSADRLRELRDGKIIGERPSFM
jgi:crotonobetainyl-CoA:carnitine CoA-transferase CaiB-like acyl-CoA transferase